MPGYLLLFEREIERDMNRERERGV